MKSTGIVRKVDDLGRIVLPKELRSTLGINERDPMEIYTEGHTIVLKKFELSCVFCNGTENLRAFKDRYICAVCDNDLRMGR